MVRVLRTVAVPLLVLTSSLVLSAAVPRVTLIGKGLIGGTADKSGLEGNICQAGVPANCVPQSIFGGFGSAIASTGHDDVYVATPDRGPFDGLTDVPFIDRVDFLHIVLDAAKGSVTTTLLDTRVLQDFGDQPFLGAAGAFGERLDPEGIRVSASGTFFVSDEYGPYVLEFNRQGHVIRRLPVPAKFAIATPSANPNDELLNNTSGRQANRGMEGLAISPDGTTLYGMMQNALLQDQALTPGTVTRRSLNTRILQMDVVTGVTHEYAYVLDTTGSGQGVSEILAINDHQFLVVERDNKSWLAAEPSAPVRKMIYKIDITGATDVSDKALPFGALPADIKPVKKSAFINLLDSSFGLHLNDTKAIAEKIEGLAWGPDLPDGRHVLYVVSDNDLVAGRSTQIFAFAINAAQLTEPITYAPQILTEPLFAPGQVKKIVGQ